MDEDKKQTSHDALREAVDDYGEDRGHDLLTDPDAVAAAQSHADSEEAITHGEKVRAARKARGFTLGELAEQSGIDEKTLAELEAGETYLPLGQLIKLSKALSMKMAEVISAGNRPFTIVRSDERQSFARFGAERRAKHGYEYESLAPGKQDAVMQPFIVTLMPAAADEPSSHDGQEFIYVLEGEMEVVVGDTRGVLKAGDAVYYDSTTIHLVKAHGDKPAKILAVLTS